jgi:PAS domain S-box-containing protein
MDRSENSGLEALEVLQAMPQGVLQLGRSGEILFVNAAGEDLLGLTSREWAGRHLLEVARVADEDQPLDLDVVGDCLASGRCWTREDARLVRSDDRELRVSYGFAPVFRAGEHVGAIFTFRDLTEHRRAESALHEARVELAAAGKAEALQAAFLHALRRDVLGPVDVLVGAAERLGAAALPAAARAEADTVRASSRSVLSVLGDLLDWAHLEAGLLEIVPVEFDLPRAMREVVAATRECGAPRGIDIELRMELDRVARVRGDAGRIRQIVAKMIERSVRLATRGPVVVEVASTWRARSDAMIRFTVAHAAPEVPRAPRAVQASALREIGPRHGFGLATRLVERMGGGMAERVRDDGYAATWFDLKLPLGTSTPRVLRSAVLRGVRALVVHSSDGGREAIGRQLATAGVRCATTNSGGQALRLLRSGLDEGDPFRIAILSAPLREMDAAALGDLVKGDPRLRDTALVYLATVGEPGDARRLEQVGFSAYLVHPVTDDLLCDALSVVWGASLVRAPAGLITRHMLRDSRIVPLTPAELRDRVERGTRVAAPESARQPTST